MGATHDALKASLVADLRTLSQEAKRPDSLAGQLTGWISGPEHPAIRDAAEKVIQRLSEEDQAPDLTESQVSVHCALGWLPAGDLNLAPCILIGVTKHVLLRNSENWLYSGRPETVSSGMRHQELQARKSVLDQPPKATHAI